LGDEYSIYSRYQATSGMVEKEEDLGRWQKSSGKDKDSKSHTVAIEKFKVEKQIGTNIFKNGSFSSNTNGINPSGGQAFWSSDKINGGTLQMTTPKSSSILITIGSIKKDKTYMVKFKGMANKNGAVKTYFRHYKSPWETVTPSTTFNLGTAQSEYQAILTPYQDVESSVLMITTEDPDFTFWMDDLEIVEVQVEMVNPGELIVFEYNASNSPKTVKLNGTYVDAKNKQHTGSVTIAPYGAVVLVKTSSEGIKEEEKALATTIQLLLPPSSTSFVEGESLELKADRSE